MTEPYDIATALLAAATSVEIDLSAPLRRRLVEMSSALIADDDRQLVVAIDRIGLQRASTSALPGGMCAAVPYVECVVRFTDYPAPLGSDGIPEPAADTVQAWAEAIHKDWWLIHGALLDAIVAGDIGIDCQTVDMGDATSFGPRGGAAGWQVTVRATLERTGATGS